MATPLKYAGLLLLSSALTTSAAYAQNTPAPAGEADAPAADAAAPQEAEPEQPDVSRARSS
jgi:hypothetical protein